jgi:hypothetical protein
MDLPELEASIPKIKHFVSLEFGCEFVSRVTRTQPEAAEPACQTQPQILGW